jgi:uncharacterized protein (DUF1697 family)
MIAMATHVILLRGVNVGGNNKVPMAALRDRLERDGFTRVRTYIQSGNILVDAAGASAKAAERVHAAIVDEFGVDVPTVALGAPGLARVVDDNPYPFEANHKLLHAIFLPAAPDAVARDRLDELNRKFAGNGTGDSMTLSGTTVYLHTPGGFGTSDLAKALTSKGRLAGGTARNWATVTTLLAMAHE